jgi:hypothetical protein
MYPNNNDNFPRTAGGYSLETYEPAVIRPEKKQRTEDLIKMAFTDKKPMTTIRRIIPRVPQYNIKPNPIVQNVQFTKLQNVPMMFQRANTIAGIPYINQNKANIYQYNNIPKVAPVPTVKSLPSNGKANPFVYQNLIQMNNGFHFQNKNAALPMNAGNRFMVGNFNNQIIRPALRSNSANQIIRPMFRPNVIQTSIISGQNYQPKVYKRELL